MNQQAKRLSRRTFLLAATAGSAATAAAIVGKAAAPEQPSTANDKRATRGYQASAHVHNYYRSTKV